jgi:tetratricopeptide (TPR) repeat protein
MSRWYLAVFVVVAARSAAASITAEGQALYEGRRYAEAEHVFQQLAAADPRDPGAVYYLGKIAIARRDYAVAIRFLEQAAALASDQSDYYLWLGNGYAWAAATATYGDKVALGRKCLAAYRRALELNPDNRWAHFGLMNFYRHVPAFLGGGLGNAYGEAEEICRRDAPLGTFALAVLATHEKNYPKAFALLEKLLRQDPACFAANLAYGRLAITTGRHLTEGEACLHHCLTLHPTENDEGPEMVRQCLGQIAEIRHQSPIAQHRDGGS